MVLLPNLSVEPFPCKVDTGAASSSLDAIVLGTELITSKTGEFQAWVRFQLPTNTDNLPDDKVHKALLLENRPIRSSNGETTERCVIVTMAELMGHRWPIEITLNDRHRMGFPMLLGRKALRRRFLVNVGRSWLGGPPPEKRN
jgi:hypothetical protein